MSTNPLEQAMIRRGIAMPALRDGLKKFRTDLIANGVGATTGVHDFGVFYVHRNVQRYVVRDGKVFDVPQRDVVKLRPEKANVTQLTESDDVRIEMPIDFGSGSNLWRWKSTSRANQFLVTAPSQYLNDPFDLVRDFNNGEQTYVLVLGTEPDATVTSVEQITVNGAGDAPLAIRFTKTLKALREAPLTSGDTPTGQPKFEAEVDAGGLKLLTDATYGREVKAWCRQRAIDISER